MKRAGVLAAQAAPGDAAMADLLRRCRTVAVVGMSAEPAKPSYFVPAEMQAKFRKRIVPVRPPIAGTTLLLGEPIVPTLAAMVADGGPLPVAELPATIVNVFRRPADVADVVRAALALPAKPLAIWCQQGVTSAEGKALAAAAGVPYVEDLCLKLEARRLLQ